MNHLSKIEDLSKEELLELLKIYAKNWLAHDGLWFQSIEQKRGIDEAIFHDVNAWEHFTQIEARRIKEFLSLPETPGLDGLQQALNFRLQATLTKPVYEHPDERTLLLKTTVCRVQFARRRKNMDDFPCKPVGEKEYSLFASTIDHRIQTECISCPPDVTQPEYGCVWQFTLSP
ncbi:MAG: DUF6125 family protein [Christensenellaceae bacterium]